MTSTRLRLLCVARDVVGGGAERVQLELLQRLDPNKFDIQLFYLRDDGVLHHLVPDDIVPIYGLPGTAGLKRNAVSLLARLVRLARQSDLIFALKEGAPMYLGALVGRLTGRSVVGWMHSVWPDVLTDLAPWYRWVSLTLYPLMDRMITPSEGTAADLVRFCPRLRGKVSVLPNPMCVQSVLDQAEAILPSWSEPIFAKRTLLAAGRLVREKGFDIMIPAFARLIRQGLDLHLLILGEGKERPDLEDRVQELGLCDRVFMPGFQLNPYPFFKRADLFVLSSRRESAGRVIMEAMALGLPVVATDCPFGPREILEGGQCGVLVVPNDADALARAIRATLDSPEKRAAVRARGLIRARDYEAAQVCASYEDLLTGVARRGTGQDPGHERC